MAIRLPLTTVLDYDDVGQTGATSVAGGVAKTFMIPQDTDNVIVKLAASVIAGGVSAAFQTTDDGGVTWYDVARTSVVSFTGRSVLGGLAGVANAEWLSIPTTGIGFRSTVVGQNSVVGTTNAAIGQNATGSAGASTLGGATFSGLPILGQLNRIFLQYTAAVSSTDLARVKVMVNNQSATA